MGANSIASKPYDPMGQLALRSFDVICASLHGIPGSKACYRFHDIIFGQPQMYVYIYVYI